MEEVRTCSCAGEQTVPEAELWAGLDRIVAEHAGQPGALVRVLQKAQDLFGYLPVEVQERIAAGLGVPVAEVYGVVSFYSYFTMVPRGKHTDHRCLRLAGDTTGKLYCFWHKTL